MSSQGSPTSVDIVVIGGGQAGMAASYYLRRTGHDFVILDAEISPGGSDITSPQDPGQGGPDVGALRRVGEGLVGG